MGQKSDAVFAGMHFIKYFDATQNETFLRNRAYPFLREVIDFYESYMTKNASTGRFDVLNSCAMENCGEQDLDSTTASSKCTAGLTLFGVARAGLNPHRGGFANSMAKSFEIGYRSADVFLLGSASGDLFNACGRFGWPGQRGFGAGDTLELLLDCDAGWLAVKLNGRL